MDWDLALTRNRRALLRLLALVLVHLGPVPGARISRAMRATALRLLRPAEAVARRLIVIAARGLRVRLRASRALPDGAEIPRGEMARGPVFALLDPLRRAGSGGWQGAARQVPRIALIGDTDMPRAAVDPAAEADSVEGAPLLRRVEAVRDALDHLPREARRLARWQARRMAARRPGRVSALRSGRPPGHRAEATHPVDVLLRETQHLALLAQVPDTS